MINTCMDCGRTCESLCPSGWSRDPNGDVRCPSCTTTATWRYDRCACGHDRWEHADDCLHIDHVGDWGEYNDDCACRSFALNA